MQKKIAVVWGYFAKNLGDDLMLKAFLNATQGKYKKIYINSYKEYRKYYSDIGVTVVSVDSFFYRVLNKFLNLFHKAELYYRYTKIHKADFIMLGGSLFAEADDYNISKSQLVNLSYAVIGAPQAYVIGSNFGPYKTKEFLQSYDTLFDKCEDICFRDNASFRMFPDKLNIRYAPDVVLSGIWDKSHQQIEKVHSVVISVINLEKRKNLKFVMSEYERMMADIAKIHLQRGDHVVLAAFCEFEGDVEACVRIKESCGSSEVEIVVYDNWKFLSVIANAKKIYGTRFHSIILSMYYNIPCVPFIYSQKTYDALVSYGTTFECVNLRNLTGYSIKDITENYGIHDIDFNIMKTATKQFEGV